MRILGIDPGLDITGYGVIDTRNDHFYLVEAGIIKTSSKFGVESRLNKIYKGLLEVIQESRPEVLVLEKLYSHYRHPVTACLLGHARGIVCLVASLKKISFFEYSSTRIRKAVLGKGNASKFQIQKMVQSLLKIDTSVNFLDVTDALAVALAHAYITKRNSELVRS